MDSDSITIIPNKTKYMLYVNAMEKMNLTIECKSIFGTEVFTNENANVTLSKCVNWNIEEDMVKFIEKIENFLQTLFLKKYPKFIGWSFISSLRFKKGHDTLLRTKTKVDFEKNIMKEVNIKIEYILTNEKNKTFKIIFCSY